MPLINNPRLWKRVGFAAARISSLFLLGLSVATTAHPQSNHGGGYEAYWLTKQELGRYEKLVLTRRPLRDLRTLSPPPANQSLVDSDALIVTTYARDSIWNIDLKPLKPLMGVERVEDGSIVIQGESFDYTPAHVEDVLKLLRTPMGTIPIHRIYGPVMGQEEQVRRLAERLASQLAEGKPAAAQSRPAEPQNPREADYPLKPSPGKPPPPPGGSARR